MKMFLIAIAALSICTTAMAQHTETGTQIKSSNNQKPMLDGKAFVVILSDNATGTTGRMGTADNDKKMESTSPAQPSRADQGMDAKAGSNDKTMNTGKKMVIRFENGMIRTSGKGEMKVEKCMYNSWGMESTGISFAADCNAAGTPGSSSMKQDKGDNTQSNSSTVSSGTSSASPASVTAKGESMSTDQTATAMTTASNKKSSTITGTVNGESIHGTMTCTKEDGSVKSYSFTGSKAGKNDLDLENEMGMR